MAPCSTATPVTRGPHQVQGMCHLCNVSKWEALPLIWSTLATLSFTAMREALGTDFLAEEAQLGYDTPFVTHTSAILVLGLTFYGSNSQRFGSAIKPFLFLEMMSGKTNDACALDRHWDAVLREGYPSLFA